MAKMLDDILLIGRAETNRLEIAPRALNLEALCRDVVRDASIIASANHHIEFTSTGQCDTIMADERLLLQALLNLLYNAVKYSPEGGTVYLSLSCDDEYAVIKVRDEGIGIPQEDLPHLFENFHRARNVGTIPGTGLGLTIAHHSIHLHGGTIQVESELGVGTEFTIRIPLEQPKPGA
jgi:signal transduction histidine kinase